MSFTVTITGIPDKELGPLLARLNLPRGVRADTKHVPDVAGYIAAPKKNRAKPMTKLTMNGRRPSSPKLIAALEQFELCEKENGIGNVSVHTFREWLKDLSGKDKLPQNMMTRLIHENYLEYMH